MLKECQNHISLEIIPISKYQILSSNELIKWNQNLKCTWAAIPTNLMQLMKEITVNLNMFVCFVSPVEILAKRRLWTEPAVLGVFIEVNMKQIEDEAIKGRS